ncbi:MAG: hypothetical protein BGO98_44720 [Myxococcales bacterium 68-20]|nr:hypothetical protein [Myxococcales bacterium]OJY27020.1 MAG: hypothetical protein BGO98_44720 [Myxococcales bacterium 68-20]
MSEEISEIATPDLVTETDVTETRIEVRLVGSAESVTRDDLTAFLQAIHRVALESNVQEVVFDLRALEFMSAACLRSMLAWMREVESAPRYLARFVSDSKRHWQRRSLEGLASIGGERVHID